LAGGWSLPETALAALIVPEYWWRRKWYIGYGWLGEFTLFGYTPIYFINPRL